MDNTPQPIAATRELLLLYMRTYGLTREKAMASIRADLKLLSPAFVPNLEKEL